jgi:hypothetical protein
LASKGERYWFDTSVIDNGFAFLALKEKIFLLTGHHPPPLAVPQKLPPKTVRIAGLSLG